MKRRLPRRSTNGPAAARAQPANHCRAIVPVDGTGIRRKIKNDYEKALRDLDRSRRELDQFHQTDLPQFTCWLNTHFGALLTELRDVGQKLAVDEELVFRVESEMLFGASSHARAYQRVMALRRNPEPPPGPSNDGDASGEERDPSGAEREQGNADEEEEDPLEELFNEIFGGFGPGERPRDKRGRRAGRHAETAEPAHGTARLKELYRALVRRLHPDTQREMTAQKTEWWHQAQTAYEAGDVEQLEVIRTLCDIGDSGTTAHTSASLLQRITAQLKSSLREIKRQLVARRRDPAWSFSRSTDRDAMAVRMRHTLTGELQEMRERWRQTQNLIAGWKAAAERLKPPRRRKNTSQGALFPF